MDQVFFKGRIKNRQKIAQDSYEIKFELDKKLDFLPGQYIWLVLPKLFEEDPRGGRRAFSISSAPDGKDVSIVFRSSKSGFKKTLIELPIGSEVEIQGPFGSTFVVDDEIRSNLIMIAGGVGVAPFLSITSALTSNETRSPMVMICLNSSKEKAIKLEELTNIAQKNIIKLVSVFDRFTIELIPKEIDFHKSIFFISGPAGMVDSVYKILKENKVNIANMRFEENYPSETVI